MINDSIEQYTASVGFAHRRDHGQFFTPFDVALFMCRWVMTNCAKEIYDPSFGLGAFYNAAQSLDPKVMFQASEIDQRILDFYLTTNTRRRSAHSTASSV